MINSVLKSMRPWSRRDWHNASALVLSTLLEFWLAARDSDIFQTYVLERARVRDWTPSMSWHILNFLAAGVVLIALMPVVRAGFFWQRVFAIILYVFPLSYFYGDCSWAWKELFGS